VNESFVYSLKLLQSVLVSIETRSQIVEHRNQNLVAEVKALQTEVAHYKQLLSNLSKNTNNSDIQSQAIAQELEHLQDAFYVAFEDRFRGNSEEIKKRLEVYLPILEKADLSTSELILDLGCGRGEWLELLQDKGYKAKGIDCNRVMVAECQGQNLDVQEADAIAHLQSLPSESLAAITGFHIIEHLPFPQLLQLFAEAIRVLKPGGISIFETPNPQNVMVGSKSFYLDPTHRNPLPSELTQFLLENTGFEPVDILPLNPVDFNSHIPGEEAIIQRFNELFYGHQDYAAIAYKLDREKLNNVEEEKS
ncbi:MAG: class I SAM-dependent methyltransferase, partial [Jaaginema sp. PMC 1078.18]|nr:class I SAM-dependent methyltransferase [Jaaginema sp. PMC 1078.18]